MDSPHLGGGERILYIIQKVGDDIKISPTFFLLKITHREGGDAYCTEYEKSGMV